MKTELVFTETEGHKARTTLEEHGRRLEAEIRERFGAGRILSSSLAATAWEDYNIRYSSITLVALD
ncbi:MAG: hypothetical protein NVSMB51_06850 [Solirubrobacteraceae bacterium]